MSRSLAPLKPAEDASIIDTTELTLGQVVEAILKEIKNAKD
jgi:cytidylate kinase